jgi:hypothetical protein
MLARSPVLNHFMPSISINESAVFGRFNTLHDVQSAYNQFPTSPTGISQGRQIDDRCCDV